MKKTLKSILSATMAVAMLGTTAVSVSAYDPGPLCYNDEEVEFILEYILTMAKAEKLSDEDIESLADIYGDKDYPNPYNGKESEIIPEWYIPGEPFPQWIIAEYYERLNPNSENYTDELKAALQNVCDKTGVTKEEIVGNVNIRDSISLRDDVDFDGEVTLKDLAVVKKYLIKDMELSTLQKRALNDDESVTIKDVARISNKLVEIE